MLPSPCNVSRTMLRIPDILLGAKLADNPNFVWEGQNSGISIFFLKRNINELSCILRRTTTTLFIRISYAFCPLNWLKCKICFVQVHNVNSSGIFWGYFSIHVKKKCMFTHFHSLMTEINVHYNKVCHF